MINLKKKKTRGRLFIICNTFFYFNSNKIIRATPLAIKSRCTYLNCLKNVHFKSDVLGIVTLFITLKYLRH